MWETPFLDGWFRTLGPAERPALAAHWARLPDDCIRRRFLRPMRADDLAVQAGAAIGPRAESIGWIRRGALRGVAELHHGAGLAEAAFTVEPAFRRRGIGQALMAHVLRRARNRGCRQLVVMTTRDNRPMIRIAEKAGARIEPEGTEVFGLFDLPAATVASRLADLGDEEAGAVAEIAAGLERMATAWMPGSRPPGN